MLGLERFIMLQITLEIMDYNGNTVEYKREGYHSQEVVNARVKEIMEMIWDLHGVEASEWDVIDEDLDGNITYTEFSLDDKEECDYLEGSIIVWRL